MLEVFFHLDIRGQRHIFRFQGIQRHNRQESRQLVEFL